jgi:hypothetical protein
MKVGYVIRVINEKGKEDSPNRWSNPAPIYAFVGNYGFGDLSNAKVFDSSADALKEIKNLTKQRNYKKTGNQYNVRKALYKPGRFRSPEDIRLTKLDREDFAQKI